MTRSIGRPAGIKIALLGALLLVLALAPSAAGATPLSGIELDDDFMVGTDDAQAVLVAASPEDCPDTDASKGDHHDRKAWVELAEEFETGAAKHAKAGDHDAAGDAYRQAACYYKRAGELEKAAEMYEAAAKEYDAAGQKADARQARQDARNIRNSMK